MSINKEDELIKRALNSCEIKSQHEFNKCNDEPSGRTDMLIQALEKIERLEKQLKIAVETLKNVIEEDMYNLDEHRAFIEQKLQNIEELNKQATILTQLKAKMN